MLIKITDLNLSFMQGHETKTIFKEASFELNEGDFVLLDGPNGSGKSSFLKVIADTIRPSRKCRLSVNITYDSSLQHGSSRFYQQIAYVPQDDIFVSNFTVLENLMSPLQICKCDDATAKEKAIALLESFNLLGAKDNLPQDLSGGQRRLLSILMAVIGNPKVLLVDEPNNDLDRENKAKILESLKALRSNKPQLAVIVISHDDFGFYTRKICLKDCQLIEENHAS
jgi:putative ABC transport system ATP-binding protein